MLTVYKHGSHRPLLKREKNSQGQNKGVASVTDSVGGQYMYLKGCICNSLSLERAEEERRLSEVK